MSGNNIIAFQQVFKFWHRTTAIYFFSCLICRFGSLIACDNFHADVHAGNLWLLRDGRIGFLDFGMFLFASLELIKV